VQGFLESGARGTRTPDLLGAIQPLCARTMMPETRNLQAVPSAAGAVPKATHSCGCRAFIGVSGTRAIECPGAATSRESAARYLHRWRAHGTAISTDCACSDVAAQLGGAEWLRIEPLGRRAERRHVHVPEHGRPSAATAARRGVRRRTAQGPPRRRSVRRDRARCSGRGGGTPARSSSAESRRRRRGRRLRPPESRRS
jgi:hypothetical protein